MEDKHSLTEVKGQPEIPRTPSGQDDAMKNERQQQPVGSIEERQVANALGEARASGRTFERVDALVNLTGEGYRLGDVAKAVEQASASGSGKDEKPDIFDELEAFEKLKKEGYDPEEAAKAVAQAAARPGYRGEIRTDEAGKPLPEDLPDSVKAVKNPENTNDNSIDLAEEAEKRSQEELARRDLLQRERYRRVERANFEELEYYSPEQVGLLFMRRMQFALRESQETGKAPGDFKWVAQGEMRELVKVIQVQDEMQFIDPATWGRRGYPPLTTAQLVQLGETSLLPLARMDKIIRDHRVLSQELILTDAEEKGLKKMNEALDKAAAEAGVSQETYIGEMERRLDYDRRQVVKEFLPARVAELKQLEDAISGFNNIYEFFTGVQAILSPSVKEYHDIMISAFGPRSRFEVKPPLGRDYKSIFEAPSLLPGTPEFGPEMLDTSFRALRDALEGKAFVDRAGKIVSVPVDEDGHVISERDRRMVKEGDIRRLPNIFANAPSAVSRERTISFVKERLFNEYSILDRESVAHQQLAEVAARFVILLGQHWDLDVSHSILVDEEKGETAMEVTYSDAPKLAYPMVRALNEAKSTRSLLGNYNYTGVMFRMTDNFLRVCSPSVECKARASGDTEEKTISRRIALWDLVFKYGLNLKDLPWLGNQEFDPDQIATPEFTRLMGELRAGIGDPARDVEWSFSDAREDALNVPYFLHLNYVGGFYDLMTVSEEYGKLMDQLNGADMWRKLNKPTDTGFDIFLSGRGLHKETIFKLKVLAKVNLVAGLLAAVHDNQLVGNREKLRVWKQHGGGDLNRGQGIQDEDYYESIFKTEFLQENMDIVELKEEFNKDTEKTEIREVPYKVDARGLIGAIRKAKRGAIPGDPVVKALRFGNKEITDIERAGLWAPYRIVPRFEDDPFYILNALKSVVESPKRRA